jgi:hypothetical protein
MPQSETIGELAKALAAAQGEMKAAAKGKVNEFFQKNDGSGGQYADLPAIWEVAREPLSKNGIAVVQSPMFDENGKAYLETTLLHQSGEWVRSCFELRPTKPDMQGMMSALTYARRGSLAAMAGIVSDFQPDDDGNAASKGTTPKPPAKTISAEQFQTIDELLAKTEMDEKKFLAWTKVGKIEDIAASDFARVKSALEKRLPK